MTALATFPITKRWPAKNPDAIQLYSLPTPNGIKISIMLEECGLAYEAHTINFRAGDTMTPEFLSLNPNNKIPAMIDPDGPGGKAFGIWESGAMLLYLAEKTGKFLPADPAHRYETIQWLFFQMAGVGPMFGQLGFFFKYAGSEWEDKRPMNRYRDETKRLLGVLDKRMEGRTWIMGDDYTIADIAILGWVRNIINPAGYNAREAVGYDTFKNLHPWLDRWLSRPAVQKGLVTPPRPEGA